VVVSQLDESLLQGLGACAREADAEDLHRLGADARWWGVGDGIEAFEEGPNGAVQAKVEVLEGVEASDSVEEAFGEVRLWRGLGGLRRMGFWQCHG
jgi:hypothetical protein